MSKKTNTHWSSAFNVAIPHLQRGKKKSVYNLVIGTNTKLEDAYLLAPEKKPT